VETRVEQMTKILKDRDMEILFARVASNLLNKDNVDEAIRICQEGLKKYPTYAQAHFVLAKCYQAKGNNEEARTELERVIKYDPNHLHAIHNLVQIYQSAGLNDLSQEFFTKLKILDPLNIGLQTPESVEKERKVEAQRPSQQEESDPLAVEKVDLTQFDNQEDDFTTIISGKQPESEEEGEEEESINLNVGVTSEELGADTEMNDRLRYEEDLRSRSGNDRADNDNDEEFEDLDELQFDSEADSGEKPEPWATAVGDNDATEIVIKKNSKKDDSRVQRIDKSKESDAEDGYQQPKIVTQTLGEILVSQKKYVEALRVFEKLKEQHPENQNLDKKITFLKKIISLEQK